MNDKITDPAAVAFPVGFCQALGARLSIEKDFEIGRAQMRIERVPGHSTPILKKM